MEQNNGKGSLVVGTTTESENTTLSKDHQNPVVDFLRENREIITLEYFNSELDKISAFTEKLISRLTLYSPGDPQRAELDSLIRTIVGFVNSAETVIRVLHQESLDRCSMQLLQWTEYQSQKHIIQHLNLQNRLLRKQLDGCHKSTFHNQNQKYPQ